ncbi:MAG: DUF2339 domain-containing protein [Rhodobacteraceae bacterium]|nr:DUF2339 domain-containing protein [Paracoccaceae bacterium]
MGFEGLIVVLGLVVLAIPVAVIWLAVAVVGLRRQVATLEAALARISGTATGGMVTPRFASAPPDPDLPRPDLPSPDLPSPDLPSADALLPDAAIPELSRPRTAPVSGADRSDDAPPGDAAADAPRPAANPWTSARGRPVAATRVVPPPAPRPPLLAPLLAWVAANWVYVVAAASLVAAGVFLLEYGIEQGLLPPAVRVMAAFALGAALVAAGERIRGTRIGDEDGATAFLPSTFSGAGVVVMFAAVIAAQGLYGLIGPAAALVGLAGVSALAVWLGWRHGPFLAALGLVGAAAAPFLTGGEADSADWLYGWFGLVALTGLAVDAVRRWGWVSALALGCAYGAGGLYLAAGGGLAGALALWAVLPILAVAVPRAELVPTHPGPTTSQALWARRWPSVPVILVAAATVMSTVLMVLALPGADVAEGWLALALLAGLAAGLTLWTRAAPGLTDAALVPAAAFLAALVVAGLAGSDVVVDFLARGALVAESGLPWDATWAVVLAVLVSLAAAVRALSDGARSPLWAGAAAVVAPAAMVAMDLFWAPAAVIGPWPWAIHALVLAGGFTLLAERLARTDAPDRGRAALAVLAVLSLLSLALFLILTKAPLTLALSAMLVAAVALDRRLGMPGLGLFVQVGVAVIGYRLIVDPGLPWAGLAPVVPVALAYLGPVAACVLALMVLRGADRPASRVVLETAAAGFAGLAASVLLGRATEAAAGLSGHWSISLQGTIWLIVALVQIARLDLRGPLRWVRQGLAAVALLLAGSAYVTGLVLLSPIWTWGELVAGPILLNTLLIAYALPAAVMLGAAARAPGLARWGRAALAVTGGALALVWAGLAIRHAWQGPDLTVPGVADGELYTYTIAMIALGAGLLWQAIRTRSVPLRRVAMAVIGLTAAKVFLIDADGLTGLMRVFAFLALGLSLAGLAWLNRWAAERGGSAGSAGGPPPST